MKHHELLAHTAERRGEAVHCTKCQTLNHPSEPKCYKCGSRLEERSDEVSAASKSASLTQIKALISQLSRVEKDTEYQLHYPYETAFDYLGDASTCKCALCNARRYVAGGNDE